MARRADICVAEAAADHWAGAGTNYIVQANNDSLYMVYIGTNLDVLYRKSSDGGLTWGSPVAALAAGTAVRLAVWYDRWTDPTGGLGDYIHIVSDDSGTDDTSYRTINTGSSDALSTQVAINAAWTSAISGGGHISVTRSVSGNVYVKVVIDAGAEGDFYRLTQANFPNGAWDNRAVDEAIATLDQMILLPDYNAADTSDVMAIFQDASVNETSRKLYDNSGDTWSETSINAAITELSTATAFPNLAVAPDPTNGNHVLLVWTQADLVNADLKCYTVDSGAITAKTDVVLNSTDDQGLCAIGIATDTGYWHAFYCGISSGGETWNTALNVYTKVSTDQGTTWGPETKVNSSAAHTIRWLTTCPRFTGSPKVAWYRDAATLDDILMSVDITQPRANVALGV
jgi:hypothetical protein